MIRLPHLETDVTLACQLSCVACNHHVALHRVVGPRQTTPAQVERDLGALAQLAHADLWGAIGGEPLLHRQLVDILVAARASRIADRLEVWTNGLLLRNATDELWRSFDILVLSIYPGTLDADDVAWVRRRCADAGVDLVVNNRPQFRALFEREPTGEARTLDKFQRCFFRRYSRVVNWGYFYTCCCAPHMPVLVANKPKGTDGIALEGLTEEALLAYLERAEPLSICSMCAGGDEHAGVIDWRQEREPMRWLRASQGGM